jgi:hypothetical protein
MDRVGLQRLIRIRCTSSGSVTSAPHAQPWWEAVKVALGFMESE